MVSVLWRGRNTPGNGFLGMGDREGRVSCLVIRDPKPKQAARPLLQGGSRQGGASKNSYHAEFIAGGSRLVKAVAEQ